MKWRRVAAHTLSLGARTVVAKDTTPAPAARKHAPEVTVIPGKAASSTGSDRMPMRQSRVFTRRSKWRITTCRTAQQRSDINPLEGGINNE